MARQFYASPLNRVELAWADEHLVFQILRGKSQSPRPAQRKLHEKYAKTYKHAFFVPQR
jgi:hypothetical protein